VIYTFLLTEAVGASGWVYAVDIAPRFLQHILGLASEKQTVNLTGVLCPEDSIGLPTASIDLAYVCDTYHHFEYPDSTLASLRRALRADARLIVIDFERIPGVTREWLLEHVRAGKPEFRAEIERAGFEFLREIEVAGLEENYVLEFRKAPE
jgi:ubiquinone/menaquinone biosynthesis C-methylase UbiE